MIFSKNIISEPVKKGLLSLFVFLCLFFLSGKYSNVQAQVTVDPNNPTARPSPQTLRDMGANNVRLVLKDDASTRTYVKELTDAGINVIGIANWEYNGAAWTTGGTLSDAYIANFQTNVLGSILNTPEFAGIRTLEIWNEPDGSEGTIPITPESFARLLVAAKAVIPQNITTISGGLVSGNLGYLQAVMDALKAMGISEFPMKNVGYHPYVIPEPYDQGLQAIIDGINAIFAMTGRQVAITEFGWETQDRIKQAEWLKLVFSLMNKQDLASKLAMIMWYGFSDGQKAGFGLYDAAGNPKESLKAFIEIMKGAGVSDAELQKILDKLKTNQQAAIGSWTPPVYSGTDGGTSGDGSGNSCSVYKEGKPSPGPFRPSPCENCSLAVKEPVKACVFSPVTIKKTTEPITCPDLYACGGDAPDKPTHYKEDWSFNFYIDTRETKVPFVDYKNNLGKDEKVLADVALGNRPQQPEDFINLKSKNPNNYINAYLDGSSLSDERKFDPQYSEDVKNMIWESGASKKLFPKEIQDRMKADLIKKGLDYKLPQIVGFDQAPSMSDCTPPPFKDDAKYDWSDPLTQSIYDSDYWIWLNNPMPCKDYWGTVPIFSKEDAPGKATLTIEHNPGAITPLGSGKNKNEYTVDLPLSIPHLTRLYKSSRALSLMFSSKSVGNIANRQIIMANSYDPDLEETQIAEASDMNKQQLINEFINSDDETVNASCKAILQKPATTLGKTTSKQYFANASLLSDMDPNPRYLAQACEFKEDNCGLFIEKDGFVKFYNNQRCSCGIIADFQMTVEYSIDGGPFQVACQTPIMGGELLPQRPDGSIWPRNISDNDLGAGGQCGNINGQSVSSLAQRSFTTRITTSGGRGNCQQAISRQATAYQDGSGNWTVPAGMCGEVPIKIPAPVTENRCGNDSDDFSPCKANGIKDNQPKDQVCCSAGVDAQIKKYVTALNPKIAEELCECEEEEDTNGDGIGDKCIRYKRKSTNAEQYRKMKTEITLPYLKKAWEYTSSPKGVFQIFNPNSNNQKLLQFSDAKAKSEIAYEIKDTTNKTEPVLLLDPKKGKFVWPFIAGIYTNKKCLSEVFLSPKEYQTDRKWCEELTNPSFANNTGDPIASDDSPSSPDFTKPSTTTTPVPPGLTPACTNLDNSLANSGFLPNNANQSISADTIDNMISILANKYGPKNNPTALTAFKEKQRALMADIVQQAKASNINPALALALAMEETHFGLANGTNTLFGCNPSGGSKDVASQISCLGGVVNAKPDNIKDFLLKYSGETGSTFCNNPNFPKNISYWIQQIAQ